MEIHYVLLQKIVKEEREQWSLADTAVLLTQRVTGQVTPDSVL